MSHDTACDCTVCTENYAELELVNRTAAQIARWIELDAKWHWPATPEELAKRVRDGEWRRR